MMTSSEMMAMAARMREMAAALEEYNVALTLEAMRRAAEEEDEA